jgi:LysM repeat protein
MGTWQFMSHTARRNGLRKDRVMDERRNFERATRAALKHLGELKEKFGKWTLAFAAYNCGEACLKREIREQKVEDYYRLNLPLETERYVFRIAAVKLILEDPMHYGYEISPGDVYRPVPCDSVQVSIRAPIHITDLARALGTDFKVIKELNPHIIGYYLQRGKYEIKVPEGLGPKVIAAVKKLTPAGRSSGRRISGKYYTVQPGDTLSAIARDTGVPLRTLRKLNGISGSLIRVGQTLRIRP